MLAELIAPRQISLWEYPGSSPTEWYLEKWVDYRFGLFLEAVLRSLGR